jgi:PRC-barrel domain
MSRETVVINENLQELHSSKYEMADGEPDIRGWKVVDSRNVQIGKIKELLFDVVSKKVRYLIVDLNGKPLNLLSRDIIIPVGLAELDATDNVVYFPDVTVGHLATLPEYEKGKVTYRTEKEIRDVFIPANSAAADRLASFEAREYPEREAFYNNDYYDATRMYRRRRMDEKIANRETEIQEGAAKKESVVYIADEKDPSVLRKAKIIKETHGD